MAVDMIPAETLAQLRTEFCDAAFTRIDFDNCLAAVEASWASGSVTSPIGLLRAWLRKRKARAVQQHDEQRRSATARISESRRRELEIDRWIELKSSPEYARFRMEIITGILANGHTPARVAELLAERRTDFPEIAPAEIESLRPMGEVWANHSPAVLAAIDAHCAAERASRKRATLPIATQSALEDW